MSKLNKSIILLFTILVLIAGDIYPNDPLTLKDSLNIVVLGSSTAAGVGASSKEKSWVGLLSSYCRSISDRISVVNLAVSGYTSYHVMPSEFKSPKNRPFSDSEHNISKALKLNPNIILVNLPTNDIASGFTVAELLQNFRVLDSIASQRNIKLYFTTSQPRNLIADTLRLKLIELKDSVLSKYGARSIDFWNGIATSQGLIVDRYNADGVHLNDIGHTFLFSRVENKDILQLHPNLVGLNPGSDRQNNPDYKLFNCYPNPFNSSTEINYKLLKKSHIELKIYDFLGQEITTLVNMQQEAGDYSVYFNAGDLSSGIYLYSLKTDRSTICKKMSLIK
ncbi:MAG: GDSL-type esterase/lipase family protein [Bacillota bacterium]